MLAHASLRSSLIGLFLLAGCSSTTALGRGVSVAHVRLDDQGRALVEVDKLYACFERAAHEGTPCRGQTLTLETWNQHIALWDALRDAIADGYKTMLAGEVAIDGWHAGDPRRWNAAERCVAAALARVKSALLALDALPEVAILVPPALSDVKPDPCNCMACGDDFYPYASVLPQLDHCESALACQ